MLLLLGVVGFLLCLDCWLVGWWSRACFVYGCFGCVLAVLAISGYLVMLLWVAGCRLWWFGAWFLWVSWFSGLWWLLCGSWHLCLGLLRYRLVLLIVGFRCD